MKQVRQALLSDYFSLPDLVSSLRERMVHLSGDDSLLDTRLPGDDQLPNEGDLVFDDPALAESIGDVLDMFAGMRQLDLSALLIVEADHVIKPNP